MVEELPFVLRQVFGVSFEEGAPNGSVQVIELFGLRLVRHAVSLYRSRRSRLGGGTMIEVVRERSIRASAGAIWAVVADVRRLPEWYTRAGKAEVLDGHGLGRRQRLTSEWRGQESEIDQVVTMFEPGRRLEWRHEAERLGGQPAPRFSAETVLSIELQPDGADRTRVLLISRQQPADPDKEAAIRGNSEFLGQMFETSLERLERVVSSG
jgi:uncharacterized protein YndB with AHSA1/START domain